MERERERERERELYEEFSWERPVFCRAFTQQSQPFAQTPKKKTVRVHGDRPVFCRAISQQSVLFAQTPATVRKKAVL